MKNLKSIEMTKVKNENYFEKRLVFIVASPRSGTTWLQRMLISSSSKIKTGPESFIFNHFIAPQIAMWERNVADGNHSLQYSLTREEFTKKLRSYTLSLMEPMIKDLKEDEIFIEKSNSHALVLSAIREIFPNSKILFMLRDPRDVVASWLAASRSWAKGNRRYTATEFAEHWKNTVLTVQEVQRSTPKHLFFTQTYESLLKNTLPNISEILRFLDVKVPEVHLKKIIKKHNIDNMKKGVGYKKILLKGDIGGKKGIEWKEPKGYFRKGVIGSWKKDLNFIEKYQIYHVAGDLMRNLGYL